MNPSWWARATYRQGLLHLGLLKVFTRYLLSYLVRGLVNFHSGGHNFSMSRRNKKEISSNTRKKKYGLLQVTYILYSDFPFFYAVFMQIGKVGNFLANQAIDFTKNPKKIIYRTRLSKYLLRKHPREIVQTELNWIQRHKKAKSCGHIEGIKLQQ